MLKRLRVTNFALIDDIDVSFHEGLTALTGETGAGKSIILESLNLLFGKRADNQMIRHNENRAIVFGLFILNKEQQELLNLPVEIEVERIVDSKGNHQLRLNKEVITLSRLREIMQIIGSIHSQNETMSLYDKNFYLSLIDQVDQENVDKNLSEYLILRSTYLNLKNNFNKLKERKALSVEKADFLAYHLEELNALDLKENEKETLKEHIDKLANYDKIINNLRLAYNAFESEYFNDSLLYDSLKSMEKISNLDTNYEKLKERLSVVYYELDDLKSEIKHELDSLDFDEQTFNLMQERLYTLEKIENKYQKTVNELILYQKEIKEELSLIINYDSYIEEQEQKVNEAFKNVIKSGTKLTNLRKQLALKLEKALLIELKELDLDKSLFKIEFEENEKEILSETGLDQIEFYISLNEGEPLKPFSKVASGGERARFMFALKSIYTKSQNLSMLVLDEIDIGISGKTAAKVAAKMIDLAKNRQLIVITHLPQVAAKALYHYGIVKQKENNRMVTRIQLLSDNERIEKIALMLSDEKLSHYAIEQAKMLLGK